MTDEAIGARSGWSAGRVNKPIETRNANHNEAFPDGLSMDDASALIHGGALITA